MSEKERKVRTTILIVMVAVNRAAQLFKEQLAFIGYSSWAVFMTNIMYFAVKDDDRKRKFWSVLGGAVCGLCEAQAEIIVFTSLEKSGVPEVLRIVLPLSAVLYCNILLRKDFPYIFNDTALVYFNVALIDAEGSYMSFVSNVIWTVAGYFAVTGLCILLINWKISRMDIRSHHTASRLLQN